MLISEIIVEKETEKSITISKKSWKRIEKELVKSQKNLSKKGLFQFSGKISLNIDPVKYQESIRNEW